MAFALLQGRRWRWTRPCRWAPGATRKLVRRGRLDFPSPASRAMPHASSGAAKRVTKHGRMMRAACSRWSRLLSSGDRRAPNGPAARFWTSKLDATRISGALCLLLLLDSWGGARSGAGGGLGVCAASLPAEQELASTVGARVPDVSVVVSLLDVGMRGDGDMSWEGQNRCLDAGRGGEVEEEVRAFVDMLAMFPWQSAYGISVELVLVVRDALGAEGRSGGAGHWVEQNEGWEAAARMVLVSKQDLPSAVLGASARRWLMGTNVGLRRALGELVTFVSLSAPPSLPLLEQVALKAAAAQNAQGLWPWFQSQGDTVWLAEEEDASMHAGMSDASLPGGAVELVPLSELVDFSIQVHVARQPAGSRFDLFWLDGRGGGGDAGETGEWETLLPMAELQGRWEGQAEAWALDATDSEAKQGARRRGEDNGGEASGWSRRMRGRRRPEPRRGGFGLGHFALLTRKALQDAGGLLDAYCLNVEDDAGASIMTLSVLQELVVRLAHSARMQVRVLKAPAVTVYRIRPWRRDDGSGVGKYRWGFLSPRQLPPAYDKTWPNDAQGLLAALEACSPDHLEMPALPANWGLAQLSLPVSIISSLSFPPAVADPEELSPSTPPPPVVFPATSSILCSPSTAESSDHEEEDHPDAGGSQQEGRAGTAEGQNSKCEWGGEACHDGQQACDDFSFQNDERRCFSAARLTANGKRRRADRCRQSVIVSTKALKAQHGLRDVVVVDERDADGWGWADWFTKTATTSSTGRSTMIITRAPLILPAALPEGPSPSDVIAAQVIWKQGDEGNATRDPNDMKVKDPEEDDASRGSDAMQPTEHTMRYSEKLLSPSPSDATKDVEYLPDATWLAAETQTLNMSFWSLARKQAKQCGEMLWQQLDALHRHVPPAECDGAIDIHLIPYGLGAVIHSIATRLHAALRLRRTSRLVGSWIYAPSQPYNADGEAVLGLSRAFDTPFSCSPVASDASTSGAFAKGSDGTAEGDKEESLEGDKSQTGATREKGNTERIGWQQDGRDVRQKLRQAHVPDAGYGACYAGGNGLLHYISGIVAWVFKPQPALRDLASSIQASIGLPARYVGVHIRHGDACYEFQDDPNAFQHMRQLLPDGIALFWNPHVDRAIMVVSAHDEALHALRQRSLWFEDKVQMAADETKARVLNDTITDVLLLAGASALVGQFSSNLPRLALELSTAQKHLVLPFISLDIPWCYAGSNSIAIEGHDGLWNC